MRRILLFVLVVSCLNGCKDDQTELFQMEIQTDFTIDASLSTVLTHYFPINNVPTNFMTYAAATDTATIGSIRSFSCELFSVFNPVNYEFIQEISILAIDPSDSNIRRELFYLDPNPIGNGTNNELQLFSSLPNHKDLLTQDLINLEVRVRLRYNSPTSSDNRMILRFKAFDTE